MCRCGTSIPTGEIVFRVTSVSASSDSLFRDRASCSLNCIRAFCHESLETLERLDSLLSKAVVSDLHELYRGLAETFAEIVGKGS